MGGTRVGGALVCDMSALWEILYKYADERRGAFERAEFLIPSRACKRMRELGFACLAHATHRHACIQRLIQCVCMQMGFMNRFMESCGHRLTVEYKGED